MKRNKTIIIIMIILGIVLSSCSKAYQPTNVPKKKSKCDTCSRW